MTVSTCNGTLTPGPGDFAVTVAARMGVQYGRSVCVSLYSVIPRSGMLPSSPCLKS